MGIDSEEWGAGCLSDLLSEGENAVDIIRRLRDGEL